MITSSSVQSLFTAAFIVRQIVPVPVPVHWSLPEFEAKLAFSSTKQNYFFIQVSLISSPFSLFPSVPPKHVCSFPSPPHFYCFPSNTITTTTFSLINTTQFLLCSLLHHRHRHHHILIVFPPSSQPPHFYWFSSLINTTQFLLCSLLHHRHHHILIVFPLSPPPPSNY